MAFVTNSLYPPIMPNVVPAFVRNLSCKIYFAISEYNSVNDIANVQISLVNVKTNTSAFNTTIYPTGIKLTQLRNDPNIQSDYHYYVVIQPSDLIDGSFKLNQYYKIQLRFTSTSAQSITTETPQSIATWLNNNLLFFSEWSRACLIRGVSRPSLELDHLDEDEENLFSTPLSKITGVLSFTQSAQKDYLAQYNIKIYVTNRDFSHALEYDSGIVYPNQTTPNVIDYDVLYDFEPSASYIIKFNYTTKFLYTQDIFYNIKMQSSFTPNPFDITAQPVADNQNGFISLKILINDSSQETRENIISIRRSSSRSNFKTWETLYVSEYFFTTLTWQDLTVQSGVWYKYRVYIAEPDNETLYSPIESQPVMCVFEDIFLVSNNIQFRLPFNPSITDFKYNVTESQQITLGNKFPYIKRNGANYYRTFSISGLISSLMDQSYWYDSYLYSDEEQEENIAKTKNIKFSTKEKIYGEAAKVLYQQYEEDHNVPKYLNPFYERLFRQTVYDFLYDGNVKLFRSPTEGNILVKLTNITFQPVSSLGRVLYSFSATAVEIDELTFENYKKYDILSKILFEIATESPALKEERQGQHLLIVINANGATQKIDLDWILHLQEYRVIGGKLVP